MWLSIKKKKLTKEIKQNFFYFSLKLFHSSQTSLYPNVSRLTATARQSSHVCGYNDVIRPYQGIGYQLYINTYNRKIRKIGPGLKFFKDFFWGAYLRREICVSKSIALAFWVGSKFTVFLCCTLYLRAVFQVQAFPGRLGGRAYIWRGDLTEVFLRYRFGGAYFRNFTVSIFLTHMGNWNSSPLDLYNTGSGLVSPRRCSVY